MQLALITPEIVIIFECSDLAHKKLTPKELIILIRFEEFQLHKEELLKILSLIFHF